MDPLADKLLVTAALVSLVELKLVASWAVVVILARGLRTLAASNGKIIAASWWGKIKTVTQMVAILLLLLKVNIYTSVDAINFVDNNLFLNSFFTYVPEIIMYIAVLITIISGIDYFIKNKHVISMN